MLLLPACFLLFKLAVGMLQPPFLLLPVDMLLLPASLMLLAVGMLLLSTCFLLLPVGILLLPACFLLLPVGVLLLPACVCVAHAAGGTPSKPHEWMVCNLLSPYSSTLAMHAQSDSGRCGKLIVLGFINAEDNKATEQKTQQTALAAFLAATC